MNNVTYAKQSLSAKDIYLAITKNKVNEGLAKIFGLDDEDDDISSSESESKEKVTENVVIVHKNAYAKCVEAIEQRIDELNLPIYSVTDSQKQRWDIIIMSISLINAFTVPLSVSFKPQSFESSYFVYLNAIIDLMFFIDIIISFRSTFIND